MDSYNYDNINLLDEYMSLQERVYEILKNDILSGKLPPNASLNTNRLSEQLHVSRTPVRDAVNKLVSIGLAVKINHREAKVADFMSGEMYEIFCARAALEGIAARSAAKYMTAEEKANLMELTTQFDQLRLSGDENAFMNLDEQFHFEIYRSLRTVLLKDMCEQLYTISKRNRDAGYHISGRSEQVVREHEELAMAIYRGDGDAAQEIGTRHHANTILRLQKKFEQLKEENFQSRRDRKMKGDL